MSHDAPRERNTIMRKGIRDGGVTGLGYLDEVPPEGSGKTFLME